VLAGLEVKQDNKDKASSRTQAMRNSVGNYRKVINNKLQNVKAIHEKKEDALGSIENAKIDDYDFDFEDEDDVIESNNLGGNDAPENGKVLGCIPNLYRLVSTILEGKSILSEC
jgi:hypothetical protein